jgi:hypothetical protein
VLWDNSTNDVGASVKDVANRPIRVCISRTHYAPICEDGLALFKLGESMSDFRPESLVNSYSTTPNPHGIAVLGNRYFIFPGIANGKLRIVDIETMKTSIINAHTYALRAVALSRDEELIATASERGTMIRIWSARDGAKIGEFRRGLDEADIFGLAFSPSSTFLASTSNKGTLHVYHLAFGAADVPEGDGPHEHRRHLSDAASGTPTAIPRANRPHSSSGLALSPPADVRYSPRKGTRPSPDISPDLMSESVILNDTPPVKTARFQDAAPSTSSTRVRSHSHRQQMSPPPYPTGGGSPNSRYSEYPWPQQAVAYPRPRVAPAPAGPVPSSANRTSKYGTLSHLPFVPSALRDVFSAASAEFQLPPVFAPKVYLTSLPPPPDAGSGDVPGAASSSFRRSHSGSALAASAASSSAASSSTARRTMPSAPQGAALPRGPRPRESLAAGAPPRGLVTWCVAPSRPASSSPPAAAGEPIARASSPGGSVSAGSGEEVCVLSVGHGGSGRLERFRVEPDGAGRVKLVFVGWKPFAEDKGA